MDQIRLGGGGGGDLSQLLTVSQQDDDGGMSYLALAGVTFQVVLQTVIICLIGYVANRTGHLSGAAQKHVSNLNAMVFTPCLIFSKMAASLSLSKLDDLAVIPVLFVVTTGVSYACGRVLSRLLRLSRSESNFVTAMAVFGNSNSLPVSLTVSLANALPILRWPDIPGDSKNSVVSRGLLYLLIFQQLGQVVRWSWGYNTLLAKPIAPPEGVADAGAGTDDVEQQRAPAPAPAPPQNAVSPTGSASGSTRSSSHVRLVTTFFHNLRAFMNPPLWAMLAALVVASIPPLKAELFERQGFLNRTVGQAFTQTGRVAIPLILVVLGSNLAPPDDAGASQVELPNLRKIVFASLVSRMLLPSLVMIPLIALSVKYLNISILDDPIFLVASFILTVSPPAIQLSQICQLNGVFEREMASVLFWGYVILTLPSSILIVVMALRVLEWSGITA